MRAMVSRQAGEPLAEELRPDPVPGPGEILLRVSACGVCRTDLHVVDGDLARQGPIVPGHEIVGRVERIGANVQGLKPGQRVGVPWLGRTCGACPYCRASHENLCDAPLFTGYTRDGGYSTHVVADARFCLPIPDALAMDDAHVAPLLCAGLIGWRSLKVAGDARRLGIYGFGAAAHIVAQVALWQGRRIFAFTRPGDDEAQRFARALGAHWAGGSDESAPDELDAAIIYAPVGSLVPLALKAVRKGGRVVCAGIHMSDIPSFAYALLWGERELVSVANLTREDGLEFFAIAREAGVKTHVTTYDLASANQALDDLRNGRLQGAAALIP